MLNVRLPIIPTFFSTNKGDIITWVWALPLATDKLGGVPRYRITITFIFTVFLFSFIHLRSCQNNQALDSTLIFIIYSSRTRLHRRIIKQNSQIDQDITKRIELRKNGKDRSDGDTIPGHSPKLGSCQGECPYPCDYVSFVGQEGGVVDDG